MVLDARTRHKLNTIRFKQQMKKRARIDRWLTILTNLTKHNLYARVVSCNTLRGAVHMRYNGTRVTYWVGVRKLIVHDKGGKTYTTYNDFSAADYYTAISSGDPNAFTKEKLQWSTTSSEQEM